MWGVGSCETVLTRQKFEIIFLSRRAPMIFYINGNVSPQKDPLIPMMTMVPEVAVSRRLA